MTETHFQRKQREIHTLFHKVEAARKKGTLSKEEQTKFLLHTFGTTSQSKALANNKNLFGPNDFDEQRISIMVTAFVAVVISMFGVLFYSVGGITGAVIVDWDAPLIAREVPTQSVFVAQDIVAQGQAQIYLEEIFVDVGESVLYFSVDGHSGVQERIHNGVLSIEGVPGTYVYAVRATTQERTVRTVPFTVTLH